MLNRFFLASIGTMALAATAFAQPAKTTPPPAPAPAKTTPAPATPAKAAPTAATPAAPAAAPTPVVPVGEHGFVSPKDLKWADGPASLPKGAKWVLVEGDLKTGPFAFRVQVPANYKIPAHNHPATEHVTVISGEVLMGVGDKLDEKAGTKIATGGFAVMPQGHNHYFFTKKKAEIQVHGMGPWGITYVNPADDPRNAAAAPATPAPATPAKAATPATPAKAAAPAAAAAPATPAAPAKK